MKRIAVNIDYEKIVGLPVQIEGVYVSNGLEVHINKRHPEMMKYIEFINLIINNPDYYGFNPNQPTDSFECLKIMEDNVLVAVKLDRIKEYYYVASIYDVTDSKLNHMIKNGRIIAFDQRLKE